MKRWDYSDIQNFTWDQLPLGGVIPDAGTADDYTTGGWRSFRPEIDFDKCTQCLFCFIYCPDTAIEMNEGQVAGIVLKHCKGCGICAEECPRDAITMHEEF